MTSFFLLYNRLVLKTSEILTKEIRKKLLLCFLALSCVQSVVIFDLGAPFKLVHVAGIVLSPLLLFYSPKYKYNFKICVLIVLLYVQTMVSYAIYGFSSWSLRMIFCTFAFLYTWWTSDDFSLDDWLWIGKNTSIFVFVCIIFNSFLQSDSFRYFLLQPKTNHPYYTSFFGGGVNLDASWLGLFTFLASASPWWLPMLAVTFVFSILTNSRAGLLAGLCFLMWCVAKWICKYFFKKNTSIKFFSSWKRKQKNISILLFLVVTLGFFLVEGMVFLDHKKAQNENITENNIQENDTNFQGATSALLDRFETVGDVEKDGGTRGRLNMWKWVPKEFKENVWGYGLGNGIKQIKENDPSIYESNIHNIYFQILLEQGIVGAVITFLIIFRFVIKEFPSLFSNPLAAFLLCYLGLGAIQFRLLDVMMWFVVGAYMSLQSIQKQSKESKI